MARIELFRQLNASKPATNTNSREGLIRSLWHQVAPSLRHDQALALEPRVVRALEDCTSLQHEYVQFVLNVRMCVAYVHTLVTTVLICMLDCWLYRLVWLFHYYVVSINVLVKSGVTYSRLTLYL
jgi:hypothetical protein